MSKTVGIIQSCYIPWKGYFDFINTVDEFVLLDCVQFTRRDWRNRNRIKTAQGLKWLTIPVNSSGKYTSPINQIEISDSSWRDKHWQTIRHTYAKAPYFQENESFVRELYETATFSLLSEINYHFLCALCSRFEIRTPIRWSSEFETPDDPSERLLAICKELDATCYLSGPAARGYLNADRFQESNIQVQWMDYSSYKEYEQMYSPFEHGVTVLDVLFNNGERSRDYLYSKPQKYNES